MPIFDQFETESRSSYSGSYNENFFFGSALKTFNVASSASINRYVVGTKTLGLFSDYRRSLWLYSDTLSYFSGSVIKGNFKSAPHFSSFDSYYDSYGPGIVDLYKKNISSTSMVAWGLKIAGVPDFGVPELSASDGIIVSIAQSGQNALTFKWMVEFPFITKNKQLRRIFDSKYQLSSKLPVSIYVRSIDGSPLTLTNVSASQLAFLLYDGTSTQYTLFDVSMSATNQFGLGPIDSGIKTGSNLTRPTIENFNKAFFGFGDGLPRIPGSSLSIDPALSTAPQFFDLVQTGSGTNWYVYGPKIRGFKYGMMNANSQYLKTIYRVGKYGQFRDRLEQPYYSKIFSNIKGLISIFRPVQVLFSNDSHIKQYVDDYKTALTSTWYNPKDSGIFDLEYRSGQPFFDDVLIPPLTGSES